MTRFPIAIVVSILSLTRPAGLRAQSSTDGGTFILLRGRDTVAVEEFSRESTKLVGTLVLHNPKKTSERYSAVIAPDATLPLIEVTTREGVDSGPRKAKIVQRARVIFKEDSVAVDEMGSAGLMTRVFGTEAGAVPYLNLSFALLEQAVRRARATPGKSGVSFFNLGGGQTLSATLTPLGADSLKLDIGNVRFDLRVDPAGRLLGGRIPVQGVVAYRK
jgi:hypothetical protein